VFLERQSLGKKQLISAIDEERAVELMREFDRVSGIAALAGAWRQSDGMSSEGDDVIGADDALVAKTEAAGEIEAPGQSAKIAGGVGGGASEALVVVAAKSGEHGIGLLQGSGVSQTEFADQAVLAGAPQALDSSLGLGRIGGDLLNAEFCQGASEMSGGLLTGELFGDGPVRIVALEDAVAIAVKTERDAVGGNQGAQGAQIAEGVFGFELKMSGQDLLGGVVLKTDEVSCGPRPWSQSWVLASVSAIMPKRGRGRRRERY
jgi:hypothetical protein